MPRDVTITLSNGKPHVYRGVPDSVTPDQIEQRATKDFPSLRVTAISGGKKPAPATPKPKPKPRQQVTGIGPLDTTLDVINEAILGGVEGAYNLGAMVTDPIAGLFASKAEMEAARRQRRNFFSDVSRTFATQERPIAREIGATLAPAGAVGRLAGLAVPLAQRIPVAANAATRFLQAAQTGGLGSGRTAAQTAAMPLTQRLVQLGERMVGGAGGGAATAALMGQDLEGVGEAAMYGAGLPVVASMLKRLGGRAADAGSALLNLVSDRGTPGSRQKAAQIIRKALGDNVDKARALFAQLSPDDRRLAEQVLVDAKIEPDTFFGLGRIAQEQLQPPGVNPMRTTLEAQAAAREARLAEAAGGATMEEVRAAARGGRQAVSREMGPQREEAFARAGLAGQIVPKAERIAQAARARADELAESRFVPRMRGLEERAVGQAELMETVPPVFPEAGALGRTREIAESAGRRADEGIAAQIALRDTARDMDALVNDLAAEGLRPMRAAPLVQALQQRLAKLDVKVDDLQRGTLKGLLRKINDATDRNGMLDARALGQIRKTGINDLVEGWMGRVSRGAAPSSGNLQRTSSLSLELRDLIDNTLSESGAGDIWPEYLRRSARGYAAVNRGELAGEALRLYKQDPTTAKAFQELVHGDQPKTVGKIMGGGPEGESFAGAFAGDPARLGALQQSAREMQNLNRMQKLRTAGAGPAANLMLSERPGLLSRGIAAATLSPFPAVRIGAVGAEQVEKAIMAPRVQRQVGEAFTSGQAMNRMLNTFPGAARISEQVSRLPAEIRNLIAQSIINRPEVDLPKAGIGMDTATQAPRGQVLLGYGIGPSGESVALYGDPSENQNAMRR
jgi:hypothetical protein